MDRILAPSCFHNSSNESTTSNSLNLPFFQYSFTMGSSQSTHAASEINQFAENQQAVRDASSFKNEKEQRSMSGRKEETAMISNPPVVVLDSDTDEDVDDDWSATSFDSSDEEEDEEEGTSSKQQTFDFCSETHLYRHHHPTVRWRLAVCWVLFAGEELSPSSLASSVLLTLCSSSLFIPTKNLRLEH
jgi:hypothetical protein